jgi:D-amino peptidase
MRVYISADIEGISGMVSWDEADPEKTGYGEFRDRMTAQVVAACEGAIAAGAKDILVKDAHWHGRNIIADRLPRIARLSRGWSGHPLMMVEGVDGGFDALMMIGYHSRAGSGGTPQAHTMSSSRITLMEVGGIPVSEFHLHGWAAGLYGVPVTMVTGDVGLGGEVSAANKKIRIVAVHRGLGGSTVALHPAEAADRIRATAEESLGGDLAECLLPPPVNPELRITYREAAQAFKAGFYPGAEQTGDHTVEFRNEDYFETLRALGFLIGI